MIIKKKVKSKKQTSDFIFVFVCVWLDLSFTVIFTTHHYHNDYITYTCYISLFASSFKLVYFN